ncbi:MAG: hypothetical protein ACK4FV_06655 [Candidatus Nitrosocaldus sp.]
MPLNANQLRITFLNLAIYYPAFPLYSIILTKSWKEFLKFF